MAGKQGKKKQDKKDGPNDFEKLAEARNKEIATVVQGTRRLDKIMEKTYSIGKKARLMLIAFVLAFLLAAWIESVAPLVLWAALVGLFLLEKLEKPKKQYSSSSGSLIEDLGLEGEKILAENLSETEEIRIKVKGSFGEALVITDKRLYVSKWGLMTGNMFGGRCNAFDFAHITSIELKKGLMTGTVEILTAATPNIKASYWTTQSNYSDNIIAFGAEKFEVFERAVKIGREAISENKTRSMGGGTKENYLDELEKLSQLKERGIIAEEEFNAKKKQILGL